MLGTVAPLMAGADLAALAALAVITLLVLLLFGYRATIGAVVQWLINSIPTLSVTAFGHGVHDVFGWIRGPLEGFNNLVYHTLGALIEADKAIWNQFVHWNAYAWQELSAAVAELAEQTEQAVGYLAKHKIGALIAVTAGPIAATLYALRSQIAALEAAGARVITKTIPPVVNEINRSKTYVQRVTKGASLAAVATIATQIPRLWHGIDEAKDAAERALRRAERTVTNITPAALVGVTLAVLGRVGLGWIRCSNVTRAGKSVCGMDRNLLESLMADTALIVGTVSLVEFSRGMQGVIREIEQPVRKFWRAV